MPRKSIISTEQLALLEQRKCEWAECENLLKRSPTTALVVFAKRRFCSHKCKSLAIAANKHKLHLDQARFCQRSGCDKQLVRRHYENAQRFRARKFCSETCRAGKGLEKFRKPNCSKCGGTNWRLLSKVYPGTNIRQRRCRTCSTQANKAWIKRSQAGKASKRKNARLSKLRKYGLTQADFDKMLLDQQSACRICGDTLEVGSNIHIDHCHSTNIVRGLLCSSCNLGLGSFKDNPLRLQRGAQYLLASLCRV